MITSVCHLQPASQEELTLSWPGPPTRREEEGGGSRGSPPPPLPSTLLLCSCPACWLLAAGCSSDYEATLLASSLPTPKLLSRSMEISIWDMDGWGRCGFLRSRPGSPRGRAGFLPGVLYAASSNIASFQ